MQNSNENSSKMSFKNNIPRGRALRSAAGQAPAPRFGAWDLSLISGSDVALVGERSPQRREQLPGFEERRPCKPLAWKHLVWAPPSFPLAAVKWRLTEREIREL